uniref:DUF551 domain-containing protein n=1 Tax=viral metagenome TaxID=1070528 RepID=A0A6M3JIQ0_9ZZZZ
MSETTWRKPSEERPPQREDVLLLVNHGERGCDSWSRVCVGYMTMEGAGFPWQMMFVRRDWDGVHTCSDRVVTHWMPLPVPPEEDA